MHPKSLPDLRHGLTSAQECARLDNPDESTNMKGANPQALHYWHEAQRILTT
jgi:hypothetical protein